MTAYYYPLGRGRVRVYKLRSVWTVCSACHGRIERGQLVHTYMPPEPVPVDDYGHACVALGGGSRVVSAPTCSTTCALALAIALGLCRTDL